MLLSIKKNCEKFIKQTHGKPQETKEFKLTQQEKPFTFKPPISIERSWMTGFTSWEVYKSVFNVIKENNK